MAHVNIGAGAETGSSPGRRQQEQFDDDKGHLLTQNQPLAVCDKTAGALAGLQRDDIFISGSTYFYDGGGCC